MTDQIKKPKKSSQFMEIMGRLTKNKGAMIGLVIIVIMGIIALLAPYITPYPYDLSLIHISEPTRQYS